MDWEQEIEELAERLKDEELEKEKASRVRARAIDEAWRNIEKDRAEILVKLAIIILNKKGYNVSVKEIVEVAKNKKRTKKRKTGIRRSGRKTLVVNYNGKYSDSDAVGSAAEFMAETVKVLMANLGKSGEDIAKLCEHEGIYRNGHALIANEGVYMRNYRYIDSHNRINTNSPTPDKASDLNKVARALGLSGSEFRAHWREAKRD